MSVSVLILTLNEELNLPACLESVSWSDDIVVFDSVSSDRTVEIAKSAGARVVQRKFDNWSSHQNWAMDNIDFKHDWVFYLDADERMTPELQAEILKIAADPDEKRAAYYAGRMNYFMDRWCKRAMTPGTIMRFFKPPNIRFERLVNPIPVIDGEYGYCDALFIHYPHFAFHKDNRPGSAIRSGKYKLILRYDDDSVELFDLEKDLGEKENLAEAKPEVAQRMKTRLDNWLEKTKAGLPEKRE